jgi:hypothetical protein
MQADLQAFLEHKPTLAEKERGMWSANSTLEAAREYMRRAGRTVGRTRGARWLRLRARSAAASFLAGMALWIGGTLGWQALHSSRKPSLATRPASPGAPAAPVAASIDLPRLYVEEAAGVFNSYLASQDNALDHFDWQKAELCLARAQQLGVSGDAVEGQLALSRGYGILERLGDARYSAEARASLRSQARTEFEAAERSLPQSPQPHVALARLAAYWEGAPDRAVTEFAAAEKLGAQPGRRELEEEADGYRLRAQRLWSWADAQKARTLYQRIPGFDQADRHLKELDRIHRIPVHRVQYSRRRRWR